VYSIVRMTTEEDGIEVEMQSESQSTGSWSELKTLMRKAADSKVILFEALVNSFIFQTGV
jgi:hypothetical protein